MAEGDGRGGRDLSPAALDARRGVSAPDRYSPPRSRRRHRARAGRLASERPPRPQVTATVGGKPPSGLGTEALLDFRMGGHARRRAADRGGDRAAARRRRTAFALVRGRWVEVDRDRLSRMLDEFRAVETAAARTGSPSPRRCGSLAGAHVARRRVAAADAPTGRASSPGRGCATTLAGLRDPRRPGAARSRRRAAGDAAPLSAGRRALAASCSRSLGLGACLADDMGLGKTMQVLALLAGDASATTRERDAAHQPAGRAGVAARNWAAEIERFAPTLRALVAHPSAMPRAELNGLDRDRDCRRRSRHHELRNAAARACAAGARRGASSSSTRRRRSRTRRASRRARSRQLDARARIALTGTPVENRLGDLWSIFDFLNPGLLGSGKAFATFTKRLAAQRRTTRTRRCASSCGRTSCAG